MRWPLLTLLLAACVTPIGAEEHQAREDLDRDGAIGKADCDDADPNVNPDAVEWCNGIDDDCDGVVDGTDARGVRPWWVDGDGDDAGSGAPVWACEAPAGAIAIDGDCADGDPNIGPGRVEACNGVDDDCDGNVDEGAAGIDWYGDADGDGYGGPQVLGNGCVAAPGWFATSDDCNDVDPDAFPGADERCNGVDDNCNGTADEGTPADATAWFEDGDGDGFGAAALATSCAAPANGVAVGGDCDDLDPLVHPDAVELCDLGVDNDCDGMLDDAGMDPADLPRWYYDSDLDGYGDPASWTAGCTAPGGYQASGADCDDSDGSVHPGQPEVCGDGIDNDCDQRGCGPEGPLVPADGDTRILGAPVADGFGTSLGAGDLDRDGSADLLIGAPRSSAVAPDAGAVYAFSGPLGAGVSDTTLAVGTAGCCGLAGGFGGVLAVGDLDGDGWPELAVAAPEDDGAAVDAGAVYLFAGPLTGAQTTPYATISGSAAGVGAAGALALVDFDGDGVSGLALGLPLDGGAGTVRLFDGPLAGDLETLDADGTWFGVTAGDRLGSAVAAGDYDGDGVQDALVGASGMAGLGAVYGMEGPFVTGDADAVSVSLVVGSGPGALGARVAALGDLNGDGREDFALADPTSDGGRGVVWILQGSPWFLSGPIDGFATAWVIGAPGDAVGASVAMGDLEGDGLNELAVGGATGAWLLDGPIDGSLDPASARAVLSSSGAAAVLVTDLTGDGFDDFLAGSPDPGGPGELTLFAGDGF